MTSASTPSETTPTPRQLWEEGAWAALSEMTLKDIAGMEGRETAALFLAAAHFHLGDVLATQTTLRQAKNWGATAQAAMALLYGGVHNTLGRLALLRDDFPQATACFMTSVKPAQTGTNLQSTAFLRQFHQMLDLGLLPAATQALSDEIENLTQTADAKAPSWAFVLDSKIGHLNHVLSLSLQKRQLNPETAQAPEQTDDFKARASHHSTSQLGQDLWVLEQCNYKRDGFFVEFGATNGILLSNSYVLETDFGWSGLCAEPNPTFFAQLRENRHCTVSSDCIGGQTGKTVRFIAANEYGGFAQYADHDAHAQKRQAYADMGQTLDLKTISLHDFLCKHGAPKTIDYLSIDTEGSEYEILSAFPFDAWNIQCITVEHNFTPMRQQIKALLESQGYVRTEMQWDDWYAKPILNAD